MGIKHILLVRIQLQIFNSNRGSQIRSIFCDSMYNDRLFCVALQTIKCLLIVPNAESALNEEAGRLLLENYEEYYKRASMMTEIHATVGALPCFTSEPCINRQTNGFFLPQNIKCNKIRNPCSEEPLAKKVASSSQKSSSSVDKPKLLKDRKRTLKRL